jgi:hypothetical protein
VELKAMEVFRHQFVDEPAERAALVPGRLSVDRWTPATANW